jgi:hypothetical protein
MGSSLQLAIKKHDHFFLGIYPIRGGESTSPTKVPSWAGVRALPLVSLPGIPAQIYQAPKLRSPIWFIVINLTVFLLSNCLPSYLPPFNNICKKMA